MIAFLAKYLSEKQKYITSFKKGLLPSLRISISCIWHDYATARFRNRNCNGWNMYCDDFYCRCTNQSFCLAWVYWVLQVLLHLYYLAPYRMKRITSFLDPWEDPLGSGFQIIQSLYAIGPGGLFGLGLGESRQKFFYLPEPQTDFIFAILSEEIRLYWWIICFIIICTYYYGEESGLH